MLWSVIGIPQLRRHPKFLPGAQSVGNCFRNTLAYLGFIAVVGSAVEVTITRFNGVIDGLGDVCGIDFP